MITEQENALLKERIAALENIVQNQLVTIAQKEAEVVQKEAVVEQQKEELARRDDLIRRIQQMLFGQKRERFEQPDNQLDLFEPVPEAVKEELEQQAADQITITYTRQKKAHPGRCEMPANLEVVETIIEPDCDATDMVCVGEEVSDKLGYQPERFYIERTIRRKYAPKSGEGAFAIAPMPEQVIEKGIPTASLLVQILIDKYVDHLPLYRIRQRFARSNIIIPESTMDGWVKTCLERLQILYDYCYGLLKAQTYLQVDETTIKVQDPKIKGDTYLGYYWAYHAPITLLALFEYKPGRGGKHVWQTLSDYYGYMQTDGYAGYNQIAARSGIVHLACMAHIRRKFFDAQNNDKARAQKALLYIQKLYAIRKQGYGAAAQC